MPTAKVGVVSAVRSSVLLPPRSEAALRSGAVGVVAPVGAALTRRLLTPGSVRFSARIWK